MLRHSLVGPALCFLIGGGSLAISPDPANLKKPEKKLQAQAEVSDISGYYTCKGLEAGGKTYKGIAVVSKKNEVFVIQWMVGGGSTFTGIGIRQGDMLSASWAMSTEKGIVRGVNQYRIEPGPRLTGRWATLPGNGVMQSETLTFLKALEEEE